MAESQNIPDPETTVEIAGAGPAGLAAAITLASAGRKVIVHEMHSEVGHRFDGDFQGLENWSTAEDVLTKWKSLGLTTSFNTVACNRGIVFNSSGDGYEITTPDALFYLVERGPDPGTLDSAMLRQARSLGVEIHFNSRLRQMTGEGILATGPRSADAIAVGYHFETDMADGYWAICDNDLAPQGYAYLLVFNGKGTVKSCMFSDFKREKVYVQRTLEAFQRLVGLEMKNPVPHGGCANFRIPDSAYSGRHPVAGEQAGFQDTLWGFGIRLAVSSGVLAANSLVKGKNYDRLWQRELKPQMQASIVNRAIYSLVGNRGYDWLLRRVISRPDLRRSLQRQYQLSRLKRLLGPWARQRQTSQRRDLSCNHIDCDCIYCRSNCIASD